MDEKNRERKRERERERMRGRQTDRQINTDRESERERERENSELRTHKYVLQGLRPICNGDQKEKQLGTQINKTHVQNY